MATASSIVDKLSAEFRTYPGFQPQTILVIYELMDCHQIPPGVDVRLAPIYVAKTLADAGNVCLIISSVKEAKWVDRLHRAGVDWKFTGFSEKMSENRLHDQAWFVPIESNIGPEVLARFDLVFKEVVKTIGLPPKSRKPAGPSG